eukprot:TRINITY_DN2153_c0_g2_i1.p1 TRINITY_DN2153_c0_g2~~TRINITY_DN2153_c0_g2_i1.p1  ORF type:complete len:568 (+),score=98.50 TRINITY_DN2153_c0_g2_i1:376-2079(+)
MASLFPQSGLPQRSFPVRGPTISTRTTTHTPYLSSARRLSTLRYVQTSANASVVTRRHRNISTMASYYSSLKYGRLTTPPAASCRSPPLDKGKNSASTDDVATHQRHASSALVCRTRPDARRPAGRRWYQISEPSSSKAHENTSRRQAHERNHVETTRRLKELEGRHHPHHIDQETEYEYEQRQLQYLRERALLLEQHELLRHQLEVLMHEEQLVEEEELRLMEKERHLIQQHRQDQQQHQQEQMRQDADEDEYFEYDGEEDEEEEDMVVRKSGRLQESLKHLFAGGIAGAVSRTCVSPLERLKILFQIGGGVTKYTGVTHALVSIWKAEGPLGYLRGNGTNIVRIFPYSAAQFAAYEYFKSFRVSPKGEKWFGVVADGLTPLDRFACGACAGIVSVVLTYPLDLVRTRLSAPTELQKYTGIGHAVRTIIKEEGIGAMYKGIAPTVVGIAPYVGLNFMTYETLKKTFLPDEDTNPQIAKKLGCGALAGAVAQTCTYPLDVLRRRMQMQSFGPDYPAFRSTKYCIHHIITTEGWRGFYKGMIPNYLKVVPSISISFVVYELTKTMLGA